MADLRDHLLDQVNSTVHQIETNPSELLEDVLSFECKMLNMQNEYLGAEVLVAFGGPDVRIDTRWGTVEGNWGSDRIVRSYVSEEFDQMVEELVGH